VINVKLEDNEDINAANYTSNSQSMDENEADDEIYNNNNHNNDDENYYEAGDYVEGDEDETSQNDDENNNNNLPIDQVTWNRNFNKTIIKYIFIFKG
jgi:hypothetical protein